MVKSTLNGVLKGQTSCLKGSLWGILTSGAPSCGEDQGPAPRSKNLRKQAAKRCTRGGTICWGARYKAPDTAMHPSDMVGSCPRRTLSLFWPCDGQKWSKNTIFQVCPKGLQNNLKTLPRTVLGQKNSLKALQMRFLDPRTQRSTRVSKSQTGLFLVKNGPKIDFFSTVSKVFKMT
jgi:hypothetical protein